MELKGFDQYINENFKPIDVELYEAEVIKESDIDWTDIIFNEFPTHTEKTNILKSINSLKWESVGGSKPMGPGITIKETIQEFRIPKVDSIAYGGSTFGSDKEPDAYYSVFGIQGHYSNGTYRIFFVDKGTEVVTVGSIRTDVQVKESTIDEAVSVPARKHPLYKKLLKFLSKFPDDATSWGQATEEIREMSKLAREFYTELDLDLLHDDPKALKPLDFKSFKTPSEWNTKAKAYIIDTLDKMGSNSVDQWFDKFKHWLDKNIK